MDKRQIEDFDNVIRCLNNNPLGISYIIQDHDFLTMLNTLYFPYLKPCQKRPDAYATSDDTLLLLEHFEFDSSKPTNKGSVQHQISAQTDRTIAEILSKDNFAVVAEMVTKSGKCYVDNFIKQFNNHYSRIAGYIIKRKRVCVYTSEPRADCSASASQGDAKHKVPPCKRCSSQGV